MTNWQCALCAALGIAAAAAFFTVLIRSRRNRKQQDFHRVLDTLLKPGETVRQICPQKGFHCILTNKRIIFERNGDYTAYPIKNIRKLKGLNEKGNRTSVPSRMDRLTFEIDGEYVLKNNGASFEALAGLLLQKTGANRKKTKKT